MKKVIEFTDDHIKEYRNAELSSAINQLFLLSIAPDFKAVVKSQDYKTEKGESYYEYKHGY